jgi:hypothetical protein
MQPYTAVFAKAKLTPQVNEIVIGKYRYRADISGGTGWVIEKGPDGEKKYPMEQAIGGKYVYYFLTTIERGKLQTLPLAYDVHKLEGGPENGRFTRGGSVRADASGTFKSCLLAYSGTADRSAHRGVMQADVVRDLLLPVSAVVVPWLFDLFC